MNKYVKSENGGTLMVVLAFVIVLSLVIAPLALKTSTGLRQAQSGGLKEAAYSDAHSAMTLFAKLYEDVKTETELAFGGLDSEENWIELLNGRVSDIVSDRYPNVNIEYIGPGSDSEWIFTAKKGPSVVSYDNSGSYYRSGQAIFSLREGGGSIPLPTLPPNTGGGGNDDEDDEEENNPPAYPVGGKIMLKAVSAREERDYNKMFAACRVQGSNDQASGSAPQALVPESMYFDNRHDSERAGTPEDPKFHQVYGPFLDYYTNINERINQYPFYSGAQSGQVDPRLATANSITTNTSQESLSVTQKTHWEQHRERNGDVSVSGNNTISFAFPGQVYVGGNLNFSSQIEHDRTLTIQADAPTSQPGIAVGGNLTIQGLKDRGNIVMKNSVYVKGNFTVNGEIRGDLIIEGDLIIGGNLTLSANSLKLLRVHGDLIVGGNVTISGSNSTNGSIEIGGSIMTGGNFTYSPTPNFSVGGNLLSGGSITFSNRMERSITIGGSMAAKGNISMKGMNSSANLNIAGHMLSNGNIELSDSNSTNLNSKVSVGGTVAATGNVLLSKTVNGSGILVVKDNIIAGGNFGLTTSTNDHMNGKLLMDTGNLIVFGNASFGGNLNGGYSRLLVHGIAINGYVDFNNNDYNNNNNTDRASICITGVTVS